VTAPEVMGKNTFKHTKKSSRIKMPFVSYDIRCSTAKYQEVEF